MSRIKGIALISIIVLASVGGAIAIWGASRTVTIPAGYVAIIQDPLTGEIWVEGDGQSDRTLFFGQSSRGSLLLRWLARSTLIYVATDRVDMWGQGFEDLPADADETHHYAAVQTLSKDGLAIEVDLTVRWRLNVEKILDLYRAYPDCSWRSSVIIPTIREVCRNILTKYTGMEVISNRTAVDTELAIAMELAFQNLPTISNCIVYDYLNMRNIGLPAQFTAAIEEKATQEQLAVAAMYQALQITTLAQANADALIIDALAQANATVIAAEALAAARYIDAESIGQAVELLLNATGLTGTENATLYAHEYAMMYLWIQALQVLANTSGNSTYFIVLGEGMIPYVYTLNPETP